MRNEQRRDREAVEPLRAPRLAGRVTDDERAFWRRAVAAERARQRCGRPVPFPFQEA